MLESIIQIRKHADRWPGEISLKKGFSLLHLGIALGQRGWKWQPDGGWIELGISPFGISSFLLNEGSGTGTAASNALV